MQGPRPGRECLRAAIVQQPGAVVCGAQRSNHAGLDMMMGGSMVASFRSGLRKSLHPPVDLSQNRAIIRRAIVRVLTIRDDARKITSTRS